MNLEVAAKKISKLDSYEESTINPNAMFLVTANSNDKNMSAKFRYSTLLQMLEKDIEITIIVTCEYGGTTSGSGKYYAGEIVAITATPDQNYRFSHWKEDGNTSPVRNIVVAENKTFTAVFELDMVSVIVEVEPQSGGTATGTGQYIRQSPVSLVATPNINYIFIRWEDESTTPTRLICATEDSQTYIAYFELIEQPTILQYFGTDSTGNIEFEFAEGKTSVEVEFI